MSSTNTYPNFENFGNYVLLKKLATGGMAEVFLARPANRNANGRIDVIKRILPHIADDLEFRKMFQTEIQVCMAFNHPNTVQIHDFGEINHQPYISMEYIEGKNLKEIMLKFQERGELMPIPMALSLIAQAAAGLSYAHTFVNKVTGEEVRAIHRDISPHNLIVDYEGNLKVIDFGIAKAASGMQEATQAGTIKGKFAYMAPEQISCEPLDPRVDVFALGIVIWELLTLRRTFFRPGDSDKTIMDTIVNCDYNVKAPSYYNGAVPPELDQIVLKALRRNPSERYGTAEELQVALRQVMQTNYPNYSYSENGRMMKAMFELEMMKERNELRLLNMNVQLTLTNSYAATVTRTAATTLLENSGPSYRTTTQTGEVTDVDIRLQGIEKMLKEKASTRHYIMFAVYIISIIVLKIDQSFPLFDFLIPQSRAGIAAATAARQAAEQQQPVAVNRAPAAVASAPAAAATSSVRRVAPAPARTVAARAAAAPVSRTAVTAKARAVAAKKAAHRVVVSQDQE